MGTKSVTLCELLVGDKKVRHWASNGSEFDKDTKSGVEALKIESEKKLAVKEQDLCEQSPYLLLQSAKQ